LLLSGSGEGIQLNCSNYDVDIGLHNNTSYGYYWRYKGTGTGNDNDLELWTDGMSGADIQVYNVHQDGKLGFINKVGFGTTNPLYGMIEIKKNGISDGICLNDGAYSSFRIAQVDDKVYMVRGGVLNNGIRINENGHVGINGYASSNYWLYVTGQVMADDYDTYSDSTAKKDILDIVDYKGLLQLRPVTFRFKELETRTVVQDEIPETEKVSDDNFETGEEIPETEIIIDDASETGEGIPNEYSEVLIEVPEQRAQHLRYGFLAQEVEEIYPDIVTKDEDNGKLAIKMNAFIPLLVEGFQDVYKQLDSLKQLVATQQLEIDNLLAVDESLKKSVSNTTIQEDKAILYQNVPNPFNETTIIRMYIPSAVVKAQLNIYNLQGNQIKSYPVFERGDCSFSVNAFEFQSGIYLYTLIMDGMALDTKKMILTD